MSLIKKLNGNTDIDTVFIKVLGSQRDAQGEESKIELFTQGRSYEKNGVQYITYQETEISGMEGATTLLKIYSDHVVLVRMGTIEQRQEFRVGQCNLSSYSTPFGTMKMGVRTTRLSINRAESGGRVTGIIIDYQLEIDGQWQSANTLSVTLQGDKYGH